MEHRAHEPKFPSPVTDGGGGPRSGSEGVLSGRPGFHKPLITKHGTRVQGRALRREMTPPERRLWSRLRDRQLHDLRFRRQHPLGPYIADFCCHEATLVVEVDGSTHQGDRTDRDEARDRWMVERGLRVVRVRAKDVRDNLEGVLALIASEAVRRLDSRET